QLPVFEALARVPFLTSAHAKMTVRGVNRLNPDGFTLPIFQSLAAQNAALIDAMINVAKSETLHPGILVNLCTAVTKSPRAARRHFYALLELVRSSNTLDQQQRQIIIRDLISAYRPAA